jgi:hypothetical protein
MSQSRSSVIALGLSEGVNLAKGSLGASIQLSSPKNPERKDHSHIPTIAITDEKHNQPIISESPPVQRKGKVIYS